MLVLGSQHQKKEKGVSALFWQAALIVLPPRTLVSVGFFIRENEKS